MTTYDTLSRAIMAKQQEGNVYDFNLESSLLECNSIAKKFNAHEFKVEAFYRFEGDSNPADSSILYALKTNSGIKGLLVGAYGAYSDELSSAMIDKLRIR